MPRVSRFTPLAEVPVVVVDTETTGLDVTTCRLLQIAAVRVADGQVVRSATFDRLVNPGVSIPPQSTAIHGITEAMVVGAPSFAALKPELERFVDGAVIVGQSIGFDLAVLLRETERCGAQWRQPQFLDTKLLMAALDPESRELDLDAIAARLGVAIGGRHHALDDASATAEIFVRLLPRLEAAGIRTLGDAEAHALAQTRIRARQAAAGWYDVTSLRAADPSESGRDASALARLDSFAYRHRVEHVMNRSPVIVPPATTLAAAIRRMVEEKLPALLAGDPASGRVDGIVTQRDVLSAIAEHGAAALDRKVETMMSAPVTTMPRDAFVYRALARMRRLGVGQLPVEDSGRRVIGMLALRDLLLDEAGEAVLIGDRLSTAPTPAALGVARADLPAVARQLLADDVPPPEVAAVLAAELRELIARAAVLAEKRMETEGSGRPPVPYALLALDGVGRGEALIGLEIPHALVFASGEPGGFEARWFTAFSAHLVDVLRAAGVTDGAKAAAADAIWRRSLNGWRAEIERWAADPQPSVASAAPFLDFRLAYGDDDLAEDLRTLVLERAASAPAFIRALAPRVVAASLPDNGDRVDLAVAGLYPIDATARALAIATRVRALPTAERLAEVCPRSGLSRATADELTEQHERLLGVLLAQQQRDLAAGLPISACVDLGALDADARGEVEAALRHISRLGDIVRLALALV
jgi:DNA polymerase-3 subunit epsilon/CBS domain-containing protein